MGAPEVIEGLLDERRGYVVWGRKDRVAEVDAVLAKFGVAVADDGEPIMPEEGPTGPDLETTDAKPVKRRGVKRAAKPAKKAVAAKPQSDAKPEAAVKK